MADALNIRDPSFNQQWHLLNTISPGNDLNVSGVWDMGITGKGVNAAIVDDGLDYESEDLAPNFVSILFHSGRSLILGTVCRRLI